MFYEYKDYHFLSIFHFPPHEREKIIEIRSNCYAQIIRTRLPLEPRTIQELELKEIDLN